MATLDLRIAALEIAAGKGARSHYVLKIGDAIGDADRERQIAQLIPDAGPDDLVVILRDFVDPGSPMRLHSRRTIGGKA